MYKYIIFDFDGTIVDSNQVVNEVVNDLAVKYKCEKIIPKEIKHCPDLKILRKLRLYFFIRRIDGEFKKQYGEKLESVKAFDNVISLLNLIHEAGYKVAIISSNNEENIRNFLKNKVNFDIDARSSKGLFGKHKAIVKFLKSNDYFADNILYIGDEIRDIKACKKAGVDMGFVKWGIDGNEDISGFDLKYVFASPEQLLETLLQLINDTVNLAAEPQIVAE